MALLTGMGAVTPLGVGVRAFAHGLRHGRSGTRLLPWRDPRVNTRVAATCPDFNPASVMSAADVARFPKLIPMALAAAREACAQAGLLVAGESPGLSPILDDSVIDPRQVAVILGTGAGGIDFTLDQADAGHNGRRISLWTITNATHGNLAGELSIRLGAKGPSLCVSTGCASASDAVGMGRELLMSGRPGAPRVVVVVGSDAHVRWETLAGMELLGVISTRGTETEDAAAGASRPFCKSRDGFVLGEGAWAVVLERDDDAQRDAVGRRGRVVARVRGYGVTCDAFHRVRPDPDMTESIHAMRLAMQDAQIEPTDIGVIHYHGTATQLNDALETRAVRGALGEHAANVPGHSVKSMIGHPQGASGLASLVSTLAGLTGADGGGGFLLPTINLTEPDPSCDLDYTASRSRPADPARHKIALINCLAFGAKNSALIVEVA